MRYWRKNSADHSDLRKRYILGKLPAHAIMLLIDPETADIVDGNPAAISFYGWSHEEFISKKITDINTLTNEQVFREMERAKNEQRRHFIFRHRLASGKIRDVEVYSGPIMVNNRKLLYSIVQVPGPM